MMTRIFHSTSTTTKTSTILIQISIVFLSFLKISFGEVCNYFPGYPDVSYTVSINCGNQCCSGKATSIAMACCDVYETEQTNWWWIIFPVVIGVLVLAVIGLILALICRYRKNKNKRDVTLMFPVTQTYCMPAHQCEQALFECDNSNNGGYCQTTTHHTKVQAHSQISYA